MSASKMTTQNPEVVGEVYMDPALEEELFGTMEPALEEALFGSVDNSSTVTTGPSSTSTIASTPSSQPTSTTSDIDEQALREKCFGKNAVTGTTKPSNLVKTATQLALEEEKRTKLERRAAALKASESAKKKPAPMMNGVPVGAQKRKRSDDDEGAEKEAKRGHADAAAPKIKKQPSVPIANSVQKRKRGADDESEEREIKRGLTDGIAAEIAHRREHAFSDDLKTADERRDSVTGTEGKTSGVEGTQKVQKSAEAREQHLAPSAAVGTKNDIPKDLIITEEDDEMTRMLKEELAKPCPDPYSDDDSEAEDPRVEEVLQPLTEAEKLQIAKYLQKKHEAGKPPVSLKVLGEAVKTTLDNRAKAAELEKKRKLAAQAARAPKKTSPLANDGVKADAGVAPAEEQEIEARPKLPVKSRKAVLRAEHNDAVVTASTPALAVAPEASSDTAITASKSAVSSVASPAAAAAHAPVVSQAYDTLTIPDLRELCRERGLILSGNKNVIVQRLKDFDKDSAEGRVPKGLKPVAKKKKHVLSWMK